MEQSRGGRDEGWKKKGRENELQELERKVRKYIIIYIVE